jgi:hypothetical protein
MTLLPPRTTLERLVESLLKSNLFLLVTQLTSQNASRQRLPLIKSSKLIWISTIKTTLFQTSVLIMISSQPRITIERPEESLLKRDPSQLATQLTSQDA